MNSNTLTTGPTFLNTFPIDLKFLPVTSCQHEWAKETYTQNYFKFPGYFTPPTDNGGGEQTEHHLDWIDAGNSLREQLMNSGTAAAVVEIRRLAKKLHLLREDKQEPRDLKDILGIVGDFDWYNRDIEESREIIYILTYRLFRTGYNNWALDSENKWMTDNSLHYDKVGRPESKGFAYSLTVQRSSYNITKNIQSVMKKSLAEFMVVRKRGQSTHTYFSGHVGTHQYYISTIQDEVSTRMKFQSAVKAAFTNGMTVTTMNELIQSSKDEDDTVTQSTGVSLCPSLFFIFFIIL